MSSEVMRREAVCQRLSSCIQSTMSRSSPAIAFVISDLVHGGTWVPSPSPHLSASSHVYVQLGAKVCASSTSEHRKIVALMCEHPGCGRSDQGQSKWDAAVWMMLPVLGDSTLTSLVFLEDSAPGSSALPHGIDTNSRGPETIAEFLP